MQAASDGFLLDVDVLIGSQHVVQIGDNLRKYFCVFLAGFFDEAQNEFPDIDDGIIHKRQNLIQKIVQEIRILMDHELLHLQFKYRINIF